jgi:hypothetical protein
VFCFSINLTQGIHDILAACTQEKKNALLRQAVEDSMQMLTQDADVDHGNALLTVISSSANKNAYDRYLSSNLARA